MPEFLNLREQGEATAIASPLRAAHFHGCCHYLISLDYDGTLRSLQSPHIAPTFLQLMADLRHRGVRWGINTGRKLPELLDEILPDLLHLPDFICTCERYVYMADASGIMRPAWAHNERCFSDNDMLISQYRDTIELGLERMKALYPHISWQRSDAEACSIACVNEQSLSELVPYIEDMVKDLDGLSIQRAGRFLRLSDSRYHKGTALSYVASRWGVAEENLVILGDGHNDLCAFKALPKAFCGSPHIAHPDVLHYLNRHQGYQSQEGVMEAILYWHRKMHH